MKALASLLATTALAFAAPAVATNLVNNGSFETGDFSGWERIGDDMRFTDVTTDIVGGGPTDGMYHARFGPFFASGIQQFIATTPGTVYRLEFDLANLGPPQNQFAFVFDQPQEVQTNVAAYDYVHRSVDVTAVTTSTWLGFVFSQPNEYWVIDNISVTALPAVPEPSSAALLLLGAAALGLRLKARRRGTAA
jgi:hypothetical protein